MYLTDIKLNIVTLRCDELLSHGTHLSFVLNAKQSAPCHSNIVTVVQPLIFRSFSLKKARPRSTKMDVYFCISITDTSFIHLEINDKILWIRYSKESIKALWIVLLPRNSRVMDFNPSSTLCDWSLHGLLMLCEFVLSMLVSSCCPKTCS